MTENPITKYIGNFIDELSLAGVTEAVICPGSRSTPLAILAASHPDINVHIHVDERSAAFFAMGMAKAMRKPVALICTSGTAAANFYPAVIEAHYSRIPLIILTADRPHELREVGAPQAIDQQFLFGNFVKFFTDSALPDSHPEMLAYIRSLAARAAGEAKKAPRGPVHINFPLREPLMPNLEDDPFQRLRNGSHVAVESGRFRADRHQLEALSALIKETEKGMIVCGELQDDNAKAHIVSLSQAAGYPILADPLSNLRNGSHSKETIIDGYDSLLKEEQLKRELMPELVIRFGAMPVSKPLFQLLKQNPSIRQIVVDPDGGWRDPTQLSAHMLHCADEEIAAAVASAVHSEKRSDSWLEKWRFANSRFRALLRNLEAEDLTFEGNIYRNLQHLIPENSSLFVGNSMPIRDADTFFENQERSFRIFANRGANGIDGVVSTALGIYAATKEPVTLVIGDLSFYHDLNGLLVSKTLDIPLTVVLVNNDGGGIFSFLPQSAEERYFELLFGTPTGLEFEHAAKLYGGRYVCPESSAHFADAYLSSVNRRGLDIIEVKTKRDDRVEQHRRMLDSAMYEIRKEWPF
ncbi:2-succinyl-5-enolpyruvyl-6-hydroxy-3- cyclohexene-1-carboxylate synthase [Bacillus paralicheniformis]|uniref:2-succinyl-5-enolpyruvyl-6-hydroxy-3- cyclohexene-1-carboxylic-acid synthase n=1 Tax=Bacillus paralicheniformis TaxID=1648923 RepID=UPI000F6F4A09|nr:2-succinyl-5-enolpyruvyl-6-hydroxy-3-cyclohexene-1-carboxylic-acid synthase [Bacillus paralicheniformis]TWN78542.1 2-succinyl-5-enolpyruvyl-6-hydroxy-3- cyclohexene-1-carboxylate synthase [Bacillus paralicheniformis]VEB20422.1 2-succinyl-5-enolpyruvyl-6-hydroxy-3-cyclohexene-1-carboxylate synthase [Bacillus paralicheniformis]